MVLTGSQPAYGPGRIGSGTMPGSVAIGAQAEHGARGCKESI